MHVCENGYFCPSHAHFRLGLEGVKVHVNLRHMHMLHYLTGLGGVNVHGNLRHMHMLPSLDWGVSTFVKLASHAHVRLRHWVGRVLTFMLTCVTYICYVTSLGCGGCWRLSKSAMPCSLPTRTDGHVNPKLMRSIRVWQWRWMNSKTKSLLELTGHPLKKRMAM